MSDHTDAHDACIGRAFNRRKRALKEQAEIRQQAERIRGDFKTATDLLGDLAQATHRPYVPDQSLPTYPPHDIVAALLQRAEKLEQEIAELNAILDE